MPRQVATSFQNNFIGGYVTQATALDFPENAAFDTDNVVFSEIGIASRRPGFEYENNFTQLTEDRTQLAQSTFLWKNASGDGLTNIVVQQNGGTLHFYLTGSALSLSAGRSANTVSLTSFQASGATSDNLNQNECQYSTGLGYLFVVHPFCDPFYIQYNPAGGTFSASIITFTVRDVFGIAENVLVDSRSSTLTANHEYNLLNQGWNPAQINQFSIATPAPAAAVLTPSASGGSLATGTVFVKVAYVNAAGQTLPSTESSVAVTGPSASVVVTSPAVCSGATGYVVFASTTTGTEKIQNGGATISFGTNYTITTVATGTASPVATSTFVAYPSNADVWWTYNDSTDIFNPATTMASRDASSSSAPQGYFRLNPWSTARQSTALAQTGISLTLTGTVDENSGTARPSATEFHAGRVWYAGVASQGYNTRIYVSTVVQGVTDFGFCSAQDDPTSQTLFDPLATDGVVISIPQAGIVYKMVSLGATLLVFGANGVWAITGSQGIGFTATDFSVSPVSYTRTLSGASFVIVDNTVLWWNLTGINMVVNDPSSGIKVQSLTDTKIKDFYIEAIPSTSKQFARGAYNQRTHEIVWLYTSNPPADVTSTYTFDSALCFNTLIGAFYKHNIPTSTVSINSIVVIEGASSTTGSNLVVDNSANQVVDNLANNVITFGFSQSTIQTSTKYLCSVPSSGSYKFTFAECFDNIHWMDFHENDNVGVDYTSFFTTGYLVKTQGERRFQSNYIFIFTDLTDGVVNAYTFQTLWNYGNSGLSGEWTQKQTISQTITHAETNFDAGRRRLKVRGAGTAVQFKFSSVSGQPFNIIGWSTLDTANANV